jgi:hypothetical protein
MTVVLYALGIWFLVSVPAGLFIGAVCRQNQFAPEPGDLLNSDGLAHEQPPADANRTASGFAAA